MNSVCVCVCVGGGGERKEAGGVEGCRDTLPEPGLDRRGSVMC